VCAIFISIEGIKNVFSADNFELARFEALDKEDTSLYRYGVVGYLATIGTMTPLFALFCSFYRLFVLKKEGMLFYLLFFSSFSGAFLNFTSAGRDGFVRWGLFLFFCIVFFRRHITFKLIPKLLLIILVLLLAIIGTIFIAITEDRFGEGNVMYLSLLEYIGQSFYHYSNTFHGTGNSCWFGFGSIFPFFPGGPNPLEIARMSFPFRTDVFPTFVGTFVLCVGYFRAFLMGIFFFLITCIFIKRKFTNLVRLCLF